MRLKASWAGVIAHLGEETKDGRTLVLPRSMGDSSVHTPAPVMVIIGEEAERIGTILSVSVQGSKLHAVGTLDLRSSPAAQQLIAPLDEVDAGIYVADAVKCPRCEAGGHLLLTDWVLSGITVTPDHQSVWAEPCTLKLDWKDE